MKLPTDVVRAVKRAAAHGYGPGEIAERTGLHRKTISLIINGRTHRRVPLTAYDSAVRGFEGLGDLFHGLNVPNERKPEPDGPGLSAAEIVEAMAAGRRNPAA